MKKIIMICMTLIVMSACVEHAEIYKLLPAEEADAIPYHVGQRLNFMDENGDTLTFTVTYDETKPFSEDYWDYPFDSKMSLTRQPWCYARTVQLHCKSDSITQKMLFTVIPEKYLYFRWNYDMGLPYISLKGETKTVEVNGVTYENVHVNQYYDTQSGDLYHQWYYNEEVGLIAVKNQSHLLTLLQ